METGIVCNPNISTAERRKRLASGVIMLGIALVALMILLSLGASLWWRLLLFPLLGAAASGYFQWRDKT